MQFFNIYFSSSLNQFSFKLPNFAKFSMANLYMNLVNFINPVFNNVMPITNCAIALAIVFLASALCTKLHFPTCFFLWVLLATYFKSVCATYLITWIFATLLFCEFHNYQNLSVKNFWWLMKLSFSKNHLRTPKYKQRWLSTWLMNY